MKDRIYLFNVLKIKINNYFEKIVDLFSDFQALSFFKIS